MPYSSTAQTARNTEIVLQCSSCKKWRLLRSKRKLKPYPRIEVDRELELLSYTCGSSFEDLDENDEARSILTGVVHVRANLTYKSPIELAYYITQTDPICFHCGLEENLITTAEYYPVCATCILQKDKVKRRSRSSFKPKE